MNLKRAFAFGTFAVMITLVVMAGAAGECPNAQVVHDGILKVFGRDFEVKDVIPSPISGICEAHVMVGGRYNILYVDSTGTYFFAGNLIEIATKKNLTQETLQSLNKLTAEDVKKLKELVAFTIGKKGPELFFVTDPQCPYCKKGLPIIKKLASEGKLQAHVLLFPLSFHKGAKEQSISIVCDKKGLEGLEAQYESENQCDKGKKLVEETVAFLQSKGVRGTPSYIFPNGNLHVGLIGSEDELLKMVQEESN
ncbi:DsbC family protein [Thermodesulforhabdus norvegica]|uniref:Thiol:disulfide interchange protein DsbC n=1 Tax=Thermodesulforhabdus norvegica TaxID=39841 RepID=A0A1I4SNQ6_9BACT|nr:DsbC family protein [Thermodesulforhabdus norvegica]SFM66096.1 thiol:disulfide interchange protein DsbC [Thermodesulforhabdus norvegica]